MKKQFKNPFLQGNYGPWPSENNYKNITDITGEIPKTLNGVLYRIGPNPQFPREDAHWFEGDGMIHGFFIENGKVRYQNRWVRTPRFELERNAGKALFGTISNPRDCDSSTINVPRNTANTNIVLLGGRLITLQETTFPIQINPNNLNTIGEWNFDDNIKRMSAHPHFDYQTGEMHTYAYYFDKPEIDYLVFNNLGTLKKIQKIRVPFASFMHDFFITKDYVIFPVLPLTTDFERAKQGKPVIMWEPDKGSHIGIIPRNGSERDPIWYELDAFYAYHFMNAYQEGNNIILDGMKTTKIDLFPDKDGKVSENKDSPSHLTRWKFSLDKKTCKTTQLDSNTAEFPRFDERFTGLPYRHGFCGTSVDPKNEIKDFDALIHYDLHKQINKIREFGAGNYPSEPIFVPHHQDSPEGDGVLLSVVYNAANDKSDLYILDAMNIDKKPLAIVHLPNRVPNGFHGNWYDLEQLNK